MITIKEYEGHAQNGLGKYIARIELKGTAVEGLAPYGAEGPHTIGYGNSPETALNEAYKCLGRHVSLTKAPLVKEGP